MPITANETGYQQSKQESSPNSFDQDVFHKKKKIFLQF
jgi:hypothetical protein